MKMNKSLNIGFFLLFFTLASCAPDEVIQDLPTNNDLTRMTPEERLQNAPNASFESVYLNDKNKTEDLIETNRSQFFQTNGDGQTPLMVAIRLNRKEISLLIGETLTFEELLYKDKNDRGYVSYAAQYGLIELLDLIARKYKDTLKIHNIYNFSTVDFADNQGKTSLFYAANRAVAQRIKEHWLYGVVPSAMSVTWFSGLYQARDNEQNSFIHVAAVTNRYDVILWANKELCGPALFNENAWLFGGVELLGKGIDWASNAAQTIPLIKSELVNLQNSSQDTALHLAVRQGHAEAAAALMSCRLTSYGLVNVFGRNPLSELIANMDHHTPKIDQGRRDIFDQLFRKRSKIWTWFDSINSYVDAQDSDKEFSSLHYAAKLSDPYFYNILKKHGNIHLQAGPGGQTPAGLFSARQQ